MKTSFDLFENILNKDAPYRYLWWLSFRIISFASKHKKNLYPVYFYISPFSETSNNHFKPMIIQGVFNIKIWKRILVFLSYTTVPADLGWYIHNYFCGGNSHLGSAWKIELLWLKFFLLNDRVPLRSQMVLMGFKWLKGSS